MTEQADIEIEVDGADQYLIYDGDRVAKRGPSGWVSLHPGYIVRESGDKPVIELEGQRLQ